MPCSPGSARPGRRPRQRRSQADGLRRPASSSRHPSRRRRSRASPSSAASRPPPRSARRSTRRVARTARMNLCWSWTRRRDARRHSPAARAWRRCRPAPKAPTFPKAARRLLKGTALGDRVERERREVRAAIGNLYRSSGRRGRTSSASVAADVRWAREMVSRARSGQILNNEAAPAACRRCWICEITPTARPSDAAGVGRRVRLCAPGIDWARRS